MIVKINEVVLKITGKDLKIEVQEKENKQVKEIFKNFSCARNLIKNIDNKIDNVCETLIINNRFFSKGEIKTLAGVKYKKETDELFEKLKERLEERSYRLIKIKGAKNLINYSVKRIFTDGYELMGGTKIFFNKNN